MNGVDVGELGNSISMNPRLMSTQKVNGNFHMSLDEIFRNNRLPLLHYRPSLRRYRIRSSRKSDDINLKHRTMLNSRLSLKVLRGKTLSLTRDEKIICLKEEEARLRRRRKILKIRFIVICVDRSLFLRHKSLSRRRFSIS